MRNTSAKAVKVVFEWRVPAAGRASFTQWLEQFVAGVAEAPGYEGSSVFTSEQDWLLLVRFSDRPSLDLWQASPQTIERMARAASFARAGHQAQHRIGLETWFTLPGEVAPPPPRWKMALVTWLALLPQVLVLGELLPSWLPKVGKAMVGTLVPVVLLTWVVMPWLTGLLRRWLFVAPVPDARP